MLWRAMLRGTAVGLLTTAAQTSGAKVASNKDTPVPAGTMPWLVVYTDDKKHGDYGAAPEFKLRGMVTVELRAEGATKDIASDLLDMLCEMTERTLLGGQGFPVVFACENGSAVVTPTALTGISVGMVVTGQGIPQGRFVAVQSINSDNTITLTEPFAGKTGSYPLQVGSFVGLFEMIDTVDTFTDYEGVGNRNHIASATIEIVGHAHETFDPPTPVNLSGVSLYVDTVNIFDPSGTYVAKEPFDVAPAPRTSGPDGRPEIAGSIDPQE